MKRDTSIETFCCLLMFGISFAYVSTAFAVFVTCLLLDLPRRVILAFSRKIL